MIDLIAIAFLFNAACCEPDPCIEYECCDGCGWGCDDGCGPVEPDPCDQCGDDEGWPPPVVTLPPVPGRPWPPLPPIGGELEAPQGPHMPLAPRLPFLREAIVEVSIFDDREHIIRGARLRCRDAYPEPRPGASSVDDIEFGVFGPGFPGNQFRIDMRPPRRGKYAETGRGKLYCEVIVPASPVENGEHYKPGSISVTSPSSGAAGLAQGDRGGGPRIQKQGYKRGRY